MNKKKLQDKLSSDFSKAVLLPLILATLLFVVIFVIFRIYIFSQAEALEIANTKIILQKMLNSETKLIEHELGKCVNKSEKSLEKITKKLANKALPFHAKIILLDKNNTRITMIHSLDSFDKNEYIILDKALSKMLYHVVIYIKKDNALNIVHNIQHNSLKLVFILIIAYIFVFFMMYKLSKQGFRKFSRYIVKPITLLSSISSDVTYYKKNIETFSTDIEEIDILSKNFTKIVKDIDKKSIELLDFNKKLAIQVAKTTQDLQEQNTKMKAFFETIMEAVVVFNESYNLIEINSIGVEIFGYTTDEAMLGKHILEFIIEEDQGKLKKALVEDSTKPYEVKLYKADGEIFTALVKGSNIVINNKLHRISTVIDITDVKHKEKQLLQQSKQAQMGDMISMIAHQWRQPLNAISAASIKLSMMSSMHKLEDEQVQKSSLFIEEQTQKMSATIDTFMNFVRPSQEANFFKIEHTLEEIMKIMGTQLLNHNIEVSIENKNTDVAIMGHEDLLEQVILNILSNARDAFENQEIKDKYIKISIKSKKGIMLVIKDNAGGIPQEIQERIFHPYFTTKEQGKGTGIGLYMSLDIMKKSFHGDLQYKATKNGSIFKIIFDAE